MRRSVATFGVAVLVCSSGCRFLQAATGEPNIEYSKDPQVDMKRGLEAQHSHNYQEAERYFDYVRTKFPFADVAKDAELALAENSFDKDEFTEARDRYTNFVKAHPVHPKVDFAAYRSALCHFEEFRKNASDFFIFPPSYEKDQGELKAALQSLLDFQRDYPKSPYLAQAQGKIDDAKKRLAAHEMYVAAFYYKRNRWTAAASRWEGVVVSYAHLGVDQEALFKLNDVYRDKLKAPAKADAALKTILLRYPDTAAAQKAKRLLGS